MIKPGGPARALASALPLGAVALVIVGASRGGFVVTPDDPLAPAFVAVLAIAGSLLLAWRAVTQIVVIDDDGIVARNVTATIRMHWTTIEELRQVSRPGAVMIDAHLRGSRRRLHLGAATRWNEEQAARVLGAIRAHPVAGALVSVERP